MISKAKPCITALMLLFATQAELLAQSTPAQAFRNVTLHHADGTVVSGATIVWRNGVIEAAGTGVTIPFDARVRDGGDSLHVYPGFIDGYGVWASVDPPRNQPRPERPGEPGYERAGIQPDRSTTGHFKDDRREFGEVRQLGFTTAALGTRGFFMPGQVDIYHITGADTPDHLMADRVAQKVQFVSSPGAYPNTLMGMMVSLRQHFHNATALKQHQQLYRSAPTRYSPPARDAVLEALYPVIEGDIPVFFNADSPEDIRRVLGLSRELGFRVVLVSGKEASGVAGELRAANVPVLVSVDLPEVPGHMKKGDERGRENEGNRGERGERRGDAEGTDAKSEVISEEEKNFRERQEAEYRDRVANIAALREAGVRVGFASSGMKAADFRKHLQTLVEHGYAEADIVRMLTVDTASILGIDGKTGSIERGKLANFSVMTGPLADKDTKVLFGVTAGRLTEFTREGRRR